MKKTIGKIKGAFLGLFAFSLFGNVYADNLSTMSSYKQSSGLGTISSGVGALDNYLNALTGNLNDFVKVGFILVCVGAAISLFFSNDNIVKLLSKIAFGLFLLKSCVGAIQLICTWLYNIYDWEGLWEMM